MGREVKRVALDFNWPVGKTWEGFLMPDELRAGKCPDCELGYGPEAQRMYQQWYGYVPLNPEDVTIITPDSPGLMDIMRHKIDNDWRGDGSTRRFYDNMFRTTGEDTVRAEAQRMCDIYNGQLSHNLNQDDVDALVEAGRLMDFTHTWSEGPGWVKKDPEYRPTADEVNLWSLHGMGHRQGGAGPPFRGPIDTYFVPINYSGTGFEPALAPTGCAQELLWILTNHLAQPAVDGGDGGNRPRVLST